MTTWECSECSMRNRKTARFCDQCGSARNPALSRSPTAVAEGERFVPPWEKPGFRDSKSSDRCTEPGCDKTVRQHIDEAKRLTQRVLLRAVKL